MNDTIQLIIIAILVVLVVALLVVCLSTKRLIETNAKKLSVEQRLDLMSKSFGDEFGRIRQENQNADKLLRDDLRTNLDAMSGRIDQMNNANSSHREKVYELLNAMQEKNAKQSDKQNETLQNTMAKLQESNEKKLEEMRVTVDEKLNSTLTKRLDSSFKTVSDQLENLYKSLGEMQTLSSGVTENVTALNRVLTNVKARGTWAEVQLEGILDQTIPHMYEKNVATVPGSKDRVEFAIRIPSGEKEAKDILLPVDSKFPMEDYIRLCDAADMGDAEAIKAARKALENRVASEAKSVAKYIHIPDTTPFAIMYLATEGLYAEVASSRTGLAEKLQRECNIMIAGPSTITALLNSLAMGFRTIAINEKAHEVQELLSAIKAQYAQFDTLLAKAGEKVEAAGKSISKARKRSDIIQKKLKRVEELDQTSANTLLEIDEVALLEAGEE